jgi:hypothetical protein
MISLDFYDMRDELYLTYKFNADGRPSSLCRVSARQQAMPSRHRITITVDGVEVVSKKQGWIMRGDTKDLPIQRARVMPKMGLKIDASQTDRSLPEKLWKQYGKVRVQFERLSEFYEVRDVQFDGTVAVYIPIRVVV